MADNFSQIAKDFINRANGGTGPTGTWRLEVLQKRLSSNADGTPKDRETPVRIRRFLKGIPWAQVHDAIRYLISQSPYKGIIYNGVELKGEYRPTLTQWRRDDQEQVGGNAQGSYTLIQDLIEVTDDGDSLDTVSADSCSETELTKWVWDAPEIEELPDNKGKQGETYAIRQVRRNEDGTFDYAIVKQVAKTKISGWKVTECDKYSTVRVRIFDNVYGGLYDGDPLTDGTTVLPIPAPCEADYGTLVQVSFAQNPDCTFRVTVQETVAKQNVEKTSETRKGIRGVVTSETTVATYPLPETGLDLGEQVRNELRPDGLYDVTHVTAAKEAVGAIGSACERTVFEHQHAETRNEAVRPEDEADFAGGGKTYQVQSRATEEGTWDVTRTETTEIAQFGAQKTKQKTLRGVTETTVDRNVDNSDVSVTNIGDRVSVEMTPGGKYNRTVTTISKEPVGDIGSNCETTVFQHTHVESENVPDRPESEASSAGGGKTYQVQARATEEGTWDVSRTETTELAVTGAQRMRQKTLRGVTETTVDRNVDNSDVSVTNIGDRIQVEQTPGGKWNRTVTTVSKESVGDVGSICETTVFEHRHVESENVSSRPEKEASSAGGGKTYQVQSRATEEGTWDVSRTTVEETRGVTAQHVMRKTLRGVTETTITRSTSDSSVSVSEIGDEVRVEQTPGGLWNRTVTHASHEAVGVVGKSCSSTTVVHTDTTVSNVPNGSQPDPQHQVAEVNVEKTVETRRTEEGTWDVTERTSTHVGFGPQTVSTTSGGQKKTTVEVFQNATEAPSRTEGVNREVDVSVSRNSVGSYDGRVVTNEYIDREYDLASIESEMKTTRISGFVNKEEPPSVDLTGRNVDASVSAHLNGHGTFDGTIHKETYREKEYDLASIESDMKTTRISGFVNKEEPPSVDLTGRNVEASVSAHLNGHGTFDGTIHKEEFQEKEYDLASIESDMKTTHISGFVNKEEPPSVDLTGRNVEASVSAHLNGHGTFDGTIHKEEFQEKEYDLATITSDTKDVDISGFVNKEEPPAKSYSGPNKEVSVSAHLNGHGTFDGTVHVETFKPVDATLIASTNNAGQSEEIYSYHNKTSPTTKSAGTNQFITASASMNGHGSYDGTYRITTVEERDTGWIKWESTVETPTQTLTYENGIRVFRNVTDVPKPDAGTNCTVSVHYNEVGNLDGSLSYSHLKTWTARGGGGGGSSHAGTYREEYEVKKMWGGKMKTFKVKREVGIDTWVGGEPPSASMIGDGKVIHWGGGLYQVEHGVTVSEEAV